MSTADEQLSEEVRIVWASRHAYVWDDYELVCSSCIKLYRHADNISTAHFTEKGLLA